MTFEEIQEALEDPTLIVFDQDRDRVISISPSKGQDSNGRYAYALSVEESSAWVCESDLETWEICQIGTAEQVEGTIEPTWTEEEIRRAFEGERDAQDGMQAAWGAVVQAICEGVVARLKGEI